MKRITMLAAFGLSVFAFLGFSIIFLASSNVIATQLVIALAFLANLLAIIIPSLKSYQSNIRFGSASLLFGALIGAVLI